MQEMNDKRPDRRNGTGEHVVWLRPALDGNRNLPAAFISVWRADAEHPDWNWHTFGPALQVLYDQPSQEESTVHGP